MTIEDSVQDAQFLTTSPPTFYHAKIPFKHWQLRSMLSSPSPNLLYYPSNSHIYSLDTSTRKRRLVGTLPFSPRCIGARYGWVCAGGAEDGQFATIRVRDTQGGHANIDEAMALDMDMEDDMGNRPGNRRSSATVNALGGSIVNSITLHRPPSSTSDDDVLAVLTNNDKTVRIFHLAQNRVVTTLHASVSTNHASISPDGQHLVVVGDAPKVFFYHPSVSGSCPGTPGTGIGDCGSWILSSHPPLMAGTDTDALMSTSFSPSSLHCAVASQDGIITIFDTRYLSCDDPNGPSPRVKVIESSRAYTPPGAVRSVQFSPAPWDLLVWAEHSGRVCIADCRSNFARRQVVDVLVEKDSLVEADIVEVPDLPPVWDLAHTLLGGPTNRRYTREEEETEEDASASNERTAYVSELADLVLENSNEWLASYTRPRSYYPPSHSELLSSAHLPANSLIRSSTSPRQIASENGASTPRLLRDFRDRESQIERERARQRIHDPPRRRNSTHPSYSIEHMSPVNPPPAPVPPYGSSSGSSSSASSGSRLSRSIPTNASLSSRGLEPLSTMMAERERRRSSEYRPRRHRMDMESTSYAYLGEGVDITGCTLSVDGRKLYVATDGGVVEYAVNVGARKVFPSITPR